MWFKIRVAIFVLVVLALVAFFVFFYALDGYNNSGSVDEAAKIRTLLKSIPNPDAGVGIDTDYAFKNYENGV